MSKVLRLSSAVLLFAVVLTATSLGASASASSLPFGGTLTASVGTACVADTAVTFEYSFRYNDMDVYLFHADSNGDPIGSSLIQLAWSDNLQAYSGTVTEYTAADPSYVATATNHDGLDVQSHTVSVQWLPPSIGLSEGSQSSEVSTPLALAVSLVCVGSGELTFQVVGPGAPNAPPPMAVSGSASPTPTVMTTQYTSASPGTDTITAFFQGVCIGAAVRLDCEQLHSDPVEHQWTPPVASVTLQPPSQSCTGSQVTLSATVERDNSPVSGAPVTFSIAGSDGTNLSYPATSDSSGVASVQYSRSAAVHDSITASAQVAGASPDPATATGSLDWVTCALTAAIDPRDSHQPVNSNVGVTVTVKYRNTAVLDAQVKLVERMLHQPDRTMQGSTLADGKASFVLSRPVAGVDDVQVTATVNGATAQDATTIVWTSGSVGQHGHGTASVSLAAATTQCIGTPVDLTATVKKDGAAFNGAPVTFDIAGMPAPNESKPATSDSLGLAIASYSRSVQNVDAVTASATVAGVLPSPATSVTRTIRWVPCALTAVIEPRGTHRKVGQQVTVTVTVRYHSVLQSGAQVTLAETMPHQPNRTLYRVTGGTGRATFPLSRQVAGIDALRATATYDGRTAQDATTLVWENPNSGGGTGSSGSTSKPGGSLTVANGNPIGGSNDTATGRGCPATSLVLLAIDGLTVARTTADAAGSFKTTFVAPTRPIGRHRLTATCGDVVLSTPVDYVGSGSGGAVGSALPLTTVAILGFFVLLGLPVLRPGAAMHHP